ncbi:MAG: hypothetical protein H6872_05840 [Methylobacteriaceae bacterium]|nr:hypothetical protein [Methylobacteriaceae bacterium]
MPGTGHGSGAAMAVFRTLAVAIFLWVLGVAGTFAQTQSCPTGSATKNDVSSAQDALKNKTNSDGYIGPTEECAALVQSLSPGIGKTATWEKGDSATTGDLAYGTPIATFGFDNSGNFVGQGNGSRYTPPGTGGISGKSHTAIFLNRNPDGSIQVLEQWAGGPARIDTLPPGNCERCAGSYSAIAGAKPVFGDQAGKGDGTGTGDGTGGGSEACKQDPTKANADQQSGTIDPDEVAKKIIEILGGNCWSCKIYAAIASQAGNFISQSYKQLTNNGSESGTFAVFAATLFAIVLVWKVLLILAAPASPDMLANAQAWSDIMRFLTRAAVATSLLFGSAAMTDWLTPTTLGSSDKHVNVVHDVLIDGPILAGTRVGCAVMKESLAAIQATNAISCQETGSTWMDQHTADATTLLGAWHQLGVSMVAVGGYMVADAGRFLSAAFGGSLGQMIGTAMRGGYSVGNIIKIGVIGLSGVLLIFAFLGFTFSFGLRYIDALLRAYIAMGLAPLFIILWVFDRTRPMAMAALKAILFLCMVFVVSGVAYAFAVLIVQKGLVLAGLGADFSPQNVVKAGGIILGGGSGSSGGVGDWLGVQLGGQVAADIRWDVYFILLATGSMAMGLTTVSFKIAETFMKFQQGMERFAVVDAAQSAGKSIDESFEGAKDQAGRVVGRVGRAGRGALGFGRR